MRSDELKPILDRVLPALSARLSLLAPTGEFFHIGSTAIPGSLTKGDVDVLLRVSDREFLAAVSRLKDHFTIKQAHNWTNVFASFGDDASYPVPVGIQLVVKDSVADFFLFVNAHLTANPESLSEYNRIKLEYAPLGPDEYWSAKNRFLAKILASRALS